MRTYLALCLLAALVFGMLLDDARSRVAAERAVSRSCGTSVLSSPAACTRARSERDGRGPVTPLQRWLSQFDPSDAWTLFTIAGAFGFGLLRAHHRSVLDQQAWMDMAEAEERRRRRIAEGYVVDGDAVSALVALGFSEAAAVMALRAASWRGATTAERVTNALLTVPRV